ncbi:hypothetical protein H5410_047088 [Solanum commersonii]|uniref:Uncharacterized protein n=1 Tax=Solanum commersonii TaxID=4109 RepID=A0A9J5XHM2_SOLCO|nr:hypothetical protein H5410_047088 [Solanum commersonii]
MRQYKRKRIGTSSSNPDARENVESLTATRKRGTATLQSISGLSSREEKVMKIAASNLVKWKKVTRAAVTY